MHIVGVVGLAGSGKSEASQVFVQAGYRNIYMPQPVVDELAARGWPFDEKHSRIVREDLRKLHGMDVLAALAMPRIKEAVKKGTVVLESFYSWSSYKLLKETFADAFFVLAIHASPATRKKRLATRKSRPHTAEEVDSRDISQIEHIEQSGPIARADYHIVNEGTKEELHKQVQRIITTLCARE